MNQFDVAGVLRTYSEQARFANNTEQLKEIVRELKREFSSETIRNFKVETDD